MLPNIIEAFADLPDNRRDHPNRLHKLIDIVVIVIWGTLANLDSWEDIALYARDKEELLREYLELPYGIPSRDTLIRTFALLDPMIFAATFSTWMEQASPESREIIRQLQLDGKWLLGTKNTGTGKIQAMQEALKLVTLWSGEERLVLAQQAVGEGSSEVTTAPEILGGMNLTNAVVRMDAAHAQLETLSVIQRQQGQYMVGVKKNQKNLYQAIADLFDDHQDKAETFESFDVKHGRVEQRQIWGLSLEMPCCEQLKLADCRIKQWREVGLRGFHKVEQKTRRGGKESQESRYYIASVTANAQDALEMVRGYWSIENKQHYILDVTFNEDANRTRTGFAAQNLALVRRIVLNLLSLERTRRLEAGVKKVSMRAMRVRAGWNDVALLELLGLKPLERSPTGQNSVDS
jgi:predicted transposase YbfD/YdcC